MVFDHRTTPGIGVFAYALSVTFPCHRSPKTRTGIASRALQGALRAQSYGCRAPIAWSQAPIARSLLGSSGLRSVLLQPGPDWWQQGVQFLNQKSNCWCVAFLVQHMTVHRHYIIHDHRATPLPCFSLTGHATPFIDTWRRARPPCSPPSLFAAIPHGAGASARSTAIARRQPLGGASVRCSTATMRCSACAEGTAVAAMAAAGPPLSANAGVSAPSRPLGILLAHAVASRGARAAPTALALTAPVRTREAATAMATTTGVARPPEPVTTVIAAGGSG